MNKEYFLILDPGPDGTFRIAGVCAFSDLSCIRHLFTPEEYAVFIRVFSNICNQDLANRKENVRALIAEFL